MSLLSEAQLLAIQALIDASVTAEKTRNTEALEGVSAKMVQEHTHVAGKFANLRADFVEADAALDNHIEEIQELVRVELAALAADVRGEFAAVDASLVT